MQERRAAGQTCCPGDSHGHTRPVTGSAIQADALTGTVCLSKVTRCQRRWRCHNAPGQRQDQYVCLLRWQPYGGMAVWCMQAWQSGVCWPGIQPYGGMAVRCMPACLSAYGHMAWSQTVRVPGTGVTGARPSRMASRLRSTRSAMASRVSQVALAV